MSTMLTTFNFKLNVRIDVQVNFYYVNGVCNNAKPKMMKIAISLNLKTEDMNCEQRFLILILSSFTMNLDLNV